MDKRTIYLPPLAEVVFIQGRESLLNNLSGFGDTNAPGQSFIPGDTVIDYPIDF